MDSVGDRNSNRVQPLPIGYDVPVMQYPKKERKRIASPFALLALLIPLNLRGLDCILLKQVTEPQ